MIEASLTIVVCDAGPLIHLDELGCLDLLADFARVLVPRAVWKEVSRHRPAALSRADVPLEEIGAVGPPSPELTALQSLLALHSGEVEALQVAQQEEASLLLTDDTAARLAARNLHINVHGTLGILLRAIPRQRRTTQEILAVLHALPE